MSERCEPPPEWRDQDHDCFVEVTYHEGTKEVQTFRWWAKAQGFSQGGLLCHSGPRPPERMDIGHTVCRYLAPVTPPATVAALVEALKKCADDLEARVMREYSVGILTPGVALRQAEDLAPVDAARAILALYRGEAGR